MITTSTVQLRSCALLAIAAILSCGAIPSGAVTASSEATGTGKIRRTGECTPVENCFDPYYGPAIGANKIEHDELEATDLCCTSPGFLRAPAHGAYWVAPLGDVQNGSGVFVWRVHFSTPADSAPIIVSGDLAADGQVAVAIDGVGGYLGPESLTALGYFSIAVQPSSATVHTLDFIFTGCAAYPVCSGGLDEPVTALLVTEASWSLAPEGTTLDTVPEATLVANGGVEPVTASP